MILYIKLFISMAIPFILGFLLTALIAGRGSRISFLERAGLAWSIGIGILGLLMFTMALFGISLNFQTVLIPTLVIMLVLSSYLIINKFPVFDLPSFKRFSAGFLEIIREKNQWLKIAQIALIIIITVTIAYAIFDATVKPLVEYDELWRQGAIAKIIFVTGKVFTEQSVELAAVHPYLNPLSQAWIHMGIGVWNDALGKIIFPLCFTALLFIFYANLRGRLPRFYALLFTYLLTSFPLIVFHAGTAYSDLMQTLYYSGGVLYLFRWMNEKERPYLYFSALLLGIGNFVKQSGIPLWLAATIILFVYIFVEERKGIKTGLMFLLVSAAVSFPWLYYKIGFLMSLATKTIAKLTGIIGKTAITGGEIPLSQNLPYGEPTLPNIFYHLGRRMFTYADWQILYFVLMLVLIFNWKQIWESKLKYLLLIIIMNFALIIYAFTEPSTYNYLVDGTLVQRVMMYHAPIVLFLIAYPIFTNLSAKRIQPLSDNARPNLRRSSSG